jgi:osmoprotectant transport system ATP-binding protein
VSDTSTERRSADRPKATGASIRLEHVSKRYPAQTRPAVGNLDLDVPAGEIVMLVGPSGCGKTTVLKMINRLIEPTSGRILLDGEDVTGKDPDELRRRIGYVIQAGGLFPHMTVARNVSLVPQMLKWPQERISTRVEELLDLVGLDPDTYRDRYPRELSGGQQQRVGVARGLAADPPVLLMDEPFGAVDPITRHRLQDELLQIQDELHKTIVIVTHDFDEALKLGDRIVVLDVGARVVQYGTPEEILTQPAEEFVEDFIGAGAALKQLALTRVADLELGQTVTARVGEPTADVVQRARTAGADRVVVLDRRERPLRWPTLRELERSPAVTGEVDSKLPTVGMRSPVNDALDTMLVASQAGAIVLGRRDRYAGVIAFETVVAVIARTRDAGAAS